MGVADLGGDLDDVVEALAVVHRRLGPLAEVARGLGVVLPAAELAREQAAGDRAPHEDAEALVDRDRDQLVLGLAGLQRVVDLLGDEALELVALRDPERLHDVPGRVVRAADVADLALADEGVQRLEGLLERGHAVPAVELVEVDVLHVETAQAVLDALDDVLARRAGVVGPVAHREAALGREEQVVAVVLRRLADDLLGHARRVHVGGVDEVDAVVDAQVDLAAWRPRRRWRRAWRTRPCRRRSSCPWSSSRPSVPTVRACGTPWPPDSPDHADGNVTRAKVPLARSGRAKGTFGRNGEPLRRGS